ncbi:MAG: hypothetical protein DRH21_06840 [Deltaproteobacteria bacterium]|nr:MAG: hypothetical protein DRH21_06840 [Deltaproteobacteria bacterium]
MDSAILIWKMLIYIFIIQKDRMRCSEEIEKKILLKRKLTEFSFDNMVKHFRSLISDFPDKRTGANSYYTIEDAALGAFSVFFTQSPSF